MRLREQQDRQAMVLKAAGLGRGSRATRTRGDASQAQLEYFERKAACGCWRGDQTNDSDGDEQGVLKWKSMWFSSKEGRRRPQEKKLSETRMPNRSSAEAELGRSHTGAQQGDRGMEREAGGAWNVVRMVRSGARSEEDDATDAQ